jgi:hypothetical protein
MQWVFNYLGPEKNSYPTWKRQAGKNEKGESGDSPFVMFSLPEYLK